MLFPSFAAAIQAPLARLWIAEGDLVTASRWAMSTEAGVQGVLDLGRVLQLAQVHHGAGRLDETSSVLDELLEFAPSKNLMPWGIRGRVLQALVHAAEDRREKALVTLGETFVLAEPEGYVCRFVDLGPELGDLIRDTAGSRTASTYARGLLEAFKAPPGDDSRTTPHERPSSSP